MWFELLYISLNNLTTKRVKKCQSAKVCFGLKIWLCSIRCDISIVYPFFKSKIRKRLKCESTKKWKCSNCQHLKSNNFGMLLHSIDTNDALKVIWVENYFSTTRFNDAACQMLFFILSSNAFCLQRTLLQLKTKTFTTTKRKIIRSNSQVIIFQ